MKLFNQLIVASIMTLTGLASAHAAAADSTIKTLVQQLKQATDSGLGVQTFTTGETARALVEQVYIQQNGKLDDNFSFEENSGSVPGNDSDTFGTATLKGAIDLTEELAVDTNMTDLSKAEAQAKYQEIEAIMRKLAQAGATFGYNPWGSAVCGVSYTTLFVIDVKAKTLYELIFISGPC